MSWRRTFRMQCATVLSAWVLLAAAPSYAEIGIDEPETTPRELCRRASEGSSAQPSARRLWARWMPSLRLRLSFVPNTDDDDRRLQTRASSAPFVSQLHARRTRSLTTELAAVWDVAEMFRPFERSDALRSRVRCRYVMRRWRRRARGHEPPRELVQEAESKRATSANGP